MLTLGTTIDEKRKTLADGVAKLPGRLCSKDGNPCDLSSVLLEPDFRLFFFALTPPPPLCFSLCAPTFPPGVDVISGPSVYSSSCCCIFSRYLLLFLLNTSRMNISRTYIYTCVCILFLLTAFLSRPPSLVFCVCHSVSSRIVFGLFCCIRHVKFLVCLLRVIDSIFLYPARWRISCSTIINWNYFFCLTVKNLKTKGQLLCLL